MGILQWYIMLVSGWAIFTLMNLLIFYFDFFSKKNNSIDFNFIKPRSLISTSSLYILDDHRLDIIFGQGSIYMYGGMKEDGTITREFWRLDTSSLAWSLVPTEKNSRGGKGRNGRKGRLGRREGNRRNNRSGRSRENRQENISSRREGREGREGDEEELAEDEGEANDQSAKRENVNETGGCLSSSPGPCAPIPCVGHAAVVVQKVKKNVMLVIFGHSSRYGYLNTVQEYDFGKSQIPSIYDCLYI